MKFSIYYRGGSSVCILSLLSHTNLAMSFGLRLMSGCGRVFLPVLRRPMSLCLLTISGRPRPRPSWHLQQHLLLLLLLLLENHLNLVLRLWLKSISVLAPEVRRYSEDTTTLPPPPATAYKLLLSWTMPALPLCSMNCSAEGSQQPL